ncbi:MAG: Glu-tRNA(Gln) amidotransferase subunit GatD [Candidatus Methanofastidiosia archaeon]
MNPGDRIKVKTDNQVFEGILLPRSELEDEDHITIKLDNGYNIGLKGGEIEVLGTEEHLQVFPEVELEKREGLPEISMIATGGTIASRLDYRTGGVHMLMEPKEIFFTTPELAELISLKKVVSPFRVGSESMTFKEYPIIAELAARELNEGVSGVLITHGTDTLHYTSAILSFMLQNLNKPVCLVGAQRSPDRGSFDGAINLICSAITAGYSDIGEVVIVMHGETSDTYCSVLRGTKVRKMHTTRRDAFQPINGKELARVWPSGDIEYITDYRARKDTEVYADTALQEKVAFLKAHPNCNPELLDFLVDNHYKGVLIEATALGHLPTDTVNPEYSWIPAVKRAREEGVHIAFATQCLYGRVNPYVYTNARLMFNLGVMYLEDMLPEVAFLKLAWVLGHTENEAEVRQMMLHNYSGEITMRSLVEKW